MAKILFIIPDYRSKVTDKFSRAQIVLPYGVLSLTAYLEKYTNTDTAILDFNVLDKKFAFKKLQENLTEYKPDIVGISALYNTSYPQIKPMCETVKECNKNILIVVGGIVATNLPEDLFKATDLIDAICYGEGEIPLADLFNSKKYLETFKTHKSWITREDFLNGKRGMHTMVENLDDIPVLNYKKVDFEKYTSRCAELVGENKVVLPLHSTRGCPFKCIFCSSGAIHGHKIRYMSAKRFLEDVDYIVKTYKIEKISIDDDQFLFDKDSEKIKKHYDYYYKLIKEEQSWKDYAELFNLETEGIKC